MHPAALQGALAQHEYYADRALARKVSACLSVKPVKGGFLFGPPGGGKSYLPQVLAPIFDADLVFYQVFPGLREEDLLVKLVPDPLVPSGIRAEEGPVTEATRISHEKKVVLVLDEWDKARPSADSFLLDWLQSGRVRFNGERMVANQENLFVFLTSNEERELSEPLLRRLPRIDVPVLSPAVVQMALVQTHKDHPHLGNALILYQRSLLAKLRKPATIQELRQLLDALTALGAEADWNALVYQMITKSLDDHLALKEVEGNRSLPPVTAIPELNTDAFAIKGAVASIPDSMPHLPRAMALNPAGQADLASAFGILVYDAASYDRVVRQFTHLNPGNTDPAVIDSVAQVQIGPDANRYLTLGRALRYQEFLDLQGVTGEILVAFPKVSFDRLKFFLTQFPQWEITRWSASEVTAQWKDYQAELRWTPDSFEVVWLKGGPSGTPSDDMFRQLFEPFAAPKSKRLRGVCTMKPVYLGQADDGTKLYAHYTVQRLRRASPSEGNVYYCQGALYLPVQDQGYSSYPLHPDLQFGSAFEVIGNVLTHNWGSSHRDGGTIYRGRITQEAKASTWPETHSVVHAQIRHAITRIVWALRNRNRHHAKSEG